MKIEQKYFPFLVIAVALLSRLIYFFQYAGTPFYAVPMWDAGEYHEMALALSKGDLHTAFAFRPPLYPLLLGLVYMLFGVGPLVPSLLQIAAGVYACLLVQRIATRLFGEWAGLGAGLAAALSGMMVFYDLELMPTGLEALLMLLLVESLLSMFDDSESESRKVGKSERGDPPLPPPASRSGTARGVVSAGVWFALGVLARPVILGLLPAIIFWLWWVKAGWQKIATFIAIGLSSLVFAMLLNLMAGNGALLTPAQGGVNFFIGNRPGADGFTATLPNVGSGWGWEAIKNIAEKAEGKPLSPKEIDSHYWQAGRKEITGDPAGWAKLMVRKVWLFWNHLEISNDRDIYYHAHRYPIIGWLLWVGVPFFFPLALVGIIIYYNDRRVIALYLILLFYQQVVVLFFVNGRFRHPLTPLLIILAAGGVKWLAGTVRERSYKADWNGIGAVGALAVGVVSLFAVDTGIDPKRWDYGYFTEGRALERMGQKAEAERLYQAALEANPRAPFVNFHLGDLEREKNHCEKAAVYYNNETIVQPFYGKAWNNLGLMKEATGDLEKAVGCFEEALRVRPDLTEATINARRGWERLGRIAAERGDSLLEQRAFSRMLQLAKN